MAAASGETAGRTRGTLRLSRLLVVAAKLGQRDGQTLLVSAKLKSGQARTSLGGINASLCVDSPVVREKNVDILCQKTTQEVQELHSTILPLDFLAILLREGVLNACTEAQICKD